MTLWPGVLHSHIVLIAIGQCREVQLSWGLLIIAMAQCVLCKLPSLPPIWLAMCFGFDLTHGDYICRADGHLTVQIWIDLKAPCVSVTLTSSRGVSS